MYDMTSMTRFLIEAINKNMICFKPIVLNKQFNYRKLINFIQQIIPILYNIK